MTGQYPQYPQYPQQYPPYGGQGYIPPVPPTKQPNGMATAGFVVSLIGLVLSLIPIVGTISWLICPVGLILAVVGLVQSGSRGGSGRGLGIAGIVCAVLGLIVCIAYTAAFASAFSGASGTTASPYPSYSAPGSTYSAPTSAAPSGPVTTFADGTRTIGQSAGDVPPGTYTTQGGRSCYWQRSKDTSGQIDSIISNGNITGPTTITVSSSDGALETSGGCTWTKK